jgi:hypothetical protein
MMTLSLHQRIAGAPLTAVPSSLALTSGLRSSKLVAGSISVGTRGESLRSHQGCRDWGYRPGLECVRSNRIANDCLQTKTKPAAGCPVTAAATKPIMGGFGPEVVP